MLRAALLAGLALLQAPGPTPPAGEVVVEGRREPTPVQRAERVVEALTQTSATDDLIVRRFYAACPKVVGAPVAYARTMLARLQAASALVGLPPPRGECEPDVLMVFTPDVDRFVAASQDLRDWRGFGPGFVTALRRRQDAGPRRVATFKLFLEAPNVSGGGASRLRSRVVDRYDRTVIVLRTDMVQAVRPEVLGDYLAMLALTSADETSVSPEPSVVNLLVTGGRDAPAGLTARDRAYLRAYYKAESDQGSAVTLGQIARQMLEEARRAQAGPP